MRLFFFLFFHLILSFLPVTLPLLFPLLSLVREISPWRERRELTWLEAEVRREVRRKDLTRKSRKRWNWDEEESFADQVMKGKKGERKGVERLAWVTRITRSIVGTSYLPRFESVEEGRTRVSREEIQKVASGAFIFRVKNQERSLIICTLISRDSSRDSPPFFSPPFVARVTFARQPTD